MRQAFLVFAVSSDFRQLAIKDRSGKAERLFRAAVSAYCALVRPSRRDAQQLDDLALPLYPAVPATARRYAAAALSECNRVPPSLVRRLCNEPVEICAPLLVRSAALGDVDLIMVIGRHGLGHARAIARREGLNPVIADLLDALKDPEIRRLRGRPHLHAVPAVPRRPAAIESPAEAVRGKLRAMMLPPVAPEPESARIAPAAELERRFCRLRETALTGHLPFFQTALADALGCELDMARQITRETGYRRLCRALQSLGLGEEQAFMIVAALFPATVSGPEAIRLFCYRYRLMAGQEREEGADVIAEPEVQPQPMRRAS